MSHQQNSIDGNIILDGEIPLEPEIEYASDKVNISTG